MVKVAVDENGEVIASWNDYVRQQDFPPDHEAKVAPGATPGANSAPKNGERQQGPVIGLPDMEGKATIIDLPEYDRDSFAAEADRKVGGRAGRVWLKGKNIEAAPAGDEPETAVEGALMKLRDEVRQRGGGKDAPLTAADIDRAIERERTKGRGRGCDGRQPRA